jgi:hypothetical protein
MERHTRRPAWLHRNRTRYHVTDNSFMSAAPAARLVAPKPRPSAAEPALLPAAPCLSSSKWTFPMTVGPQIFG